MKTTHNTKQNRNQTFVKIAFVLSAALIMPVMAHALPTSYYTKESKLSSGKWIKISTSEEGIYQLTYQQLRDFGFSNPSAVQVYGYGAPALMSLNNQFTQDFPDDMQPVATLHTADGRILFYGQGDAQYRSEHSTGAATRINILKTPYDKRSCYFLSDAYGVQQIPSMETPTTSPSSNPSRSHIHVDYIEVEQQNPSDGGIVFHGPSHEGGTTVGYTFTIKDFAPTDSHPGGSFFYKYAISSTSDEKLSIVLPAGLTKTSGDNSASTMIEEGAYETYSEATGYAGFTFDNPTDGNLTFGVEIPTPSGKMSYCAEDYVVLRYPRANRLDATSPFIVMNFLNKEKLGGQTVEITNDASGSIEVWNIDNAVPRAYPLTDNNLNGSATFILDGYSSTAVAFNPSQTFPSPTVIGNVTNQNLHGASTPDMLIITLSENEAVAEQLAEIHRRYQGMDVMVVTQDKIFNEFSSGSRHAMAYRRFAKMLYDRNPDKLKYILLFGPVHYDNRCIVTPDVDRLICFAQDNEALCDNVITNYSADVYFGMLDDSYRHENIHLTRTQVSVGRVPGTTSQLATYVDKVRARFMNPLPAQAYNHILLFGGPGDNTKHSTQAMDVYDTIRNSISPNFSFSLPHVELFDPSNSEAPANAISEALKRGTGYFAYIGHGALTSISNWGNGEVNKTDYDYAPFVMFASCNQFAFDNSTTGLVSNMLFKKNGGALGGIAALRQVYIDHNPMISLPVSIAYAQAKPGETFGDIWKRSRDIALDDLEQNPMNFPLKSTTFRNILSYNLAGDPAIPVGVANLNANLTSINGVSPASGEIKPMEMTKFSGSVSRNGQTDGSFNGTVRVEVLEGAHTANTRNVGGNEAGVPYVPLTITNDNDVLAVATGEVKNGLFNIETSVPVPTYPAGTHRVIVTAYSNNGTALGVYPGIKIADFDAASFDDKDMIAPSIKSMYADSPSYMPGDEISGSTVVYAVVDPSPSGLAYTTGKVSTSSKVIIDGTVQENGLDYYLSRRGDGMYDVTIPVTDLTEGYHSIEICVVNNIGLVDRANVEVIVTESSLKAGLSVAETPARESATITADNSVSASRLIIRNSAGATVRSIANPTFPYIWDLKDSEGNNVADGQYNATVLLQNGSQYGSSDPLEIIVLR